MSALSMYSTVNTGEKSKDFLICSKFSSLILYIPLISSYGLFKNSINSSIFFFLLNMLYLYLPESFTSRHYYLDTDSTKLCLLFVWLSMKKGSLFGFQK